MTTRYTLRRVRSDDAHAVLDPAGGIITLGDGDHGRAK